MKKLTAFNHICKGREVKIQLSSYKDEKHVEGFCFRNTYIGVVGATIHCPETNSRYFGIERMIKDNLDNDNVALNDAVVAVLKKMEQGRWA